MKFIKKLWSIIVRLIVRIFKHNKKAQEGVKSFKEFKKRQKRTLYSLFKNQRQNAKALQKSKSQETPSPKFFCKISTVFSPSQFAEVKR